MHTTKTRVIAIAIFIFGIGACDTEPEDWQTAQNDGSVEAYTAYLTAHPSGSHAAEARAIRDLLLKNSAWDEARASDTEQAYTQYLESWGDGAHAQEARVRRAGLAFDYVRVNIGLNTPEGTFFTSPLLGPIESYPEGTELSLQLSSTEGGSDGTVATVDAVYDGMEEGNGRFVAADGTCLWLGPTAATVEPCPDYDAPLPEPDDPSAVLLYTWMSDYD